MSQENPPATPGRPLRLRTRKIISGNAETAGHTTVFCPRRGTALGFAECMACEHCDGVVPSRNGGGAFLWCRGAPATEPEIPQRFIAAPLADRVPVRVAMTGNVACVREDVSIETVTALLLERGISGVPVVDADGFPVGMISKTDLVRERYENGETDQEPLRVRTRRATYDLGDGFHAEPMPRATVGDVMMPVVFTLRESDSLSQAAALMAFEGVHRLPVVDVDGKVAGILSALDVMRWLAQHDGYLVPEREGMAPRPGDDVQGGKDAGS